jgi:murein DD-endopeptidase MepM/ murein hydrolase activator NlpD
VFLAPLVLSAMTSVVASAAGALAMGAPLAAPAAAVADPWTWPVDGPIVRAYDPPDDPFGAGHRGIDIAAATSTAVLAPADGTVTFAGPVGGRLFVSIDHGGGVVSTSSYLSSLDVRRNDRVTWGQPLGLSGSGHAGATVPHVHFSVRVDGVYDDPLAYLAAPDLGAVLRLAPLG